MPHDRKPLRQCMGCRQHLTKDALLRIVRSPEGVPSLDDSRKAQGRGAYLCLSPECLRRVRKSRALERSLKTVLPAELYALLEERIAVTASAGDGGHEP